MTKNRVCRVCYQPFTAKKGARTCSARCRKRLQRTREELGGGLTSRKFALSRAKVLLLAAAGTAFLLISSPAASVLANIPTGYRTKDTSLTQNMAVTLTGEKEGNDLLVEAADSSRSKYALGVVVNLSESLIALSSVSPGVFVTSTGPVEVYVSDLNGAPKTGDLLALSPLKGILVKSVDQSEYTFGSALENFATESSQPIEVTANDGKTLTANVALMKANVDVNPPLKSDPASDNDWLQSFATNLTGRELSSFRIIALILVFVTMMVIAGEVIFSVVSGSITAVGRNPLARKAIAGQALRSFVLAGLVLAAGVSIIFLLIWL